MDEKNILQKLVQIEDIAEKKAGIYGRLLTEPTLAQAMEKTAMAHKERKQALSALLGEDS